MVRCDSGPAFERTPYGTSPVQPETPHLALPRKPRCAKRRRAAAAVFGATEPFIATAIRGRTGRGVRLSTTAGRRAIGGHCHHGRIRPKYGRGALRKRNCGPGSRGRARRRTRCRSRSLVRSTRRVSIGDRRTDSLAGPSGVWSGALLPLLVGERAARMMSEPSSQWRPEKCLLECDTLPANGDSCLTLPWVLSHLEDRCSVDLKHSPFRSDACGIGCLDECVALRV